MQCLKKASPTVKNVICETASAVERVKLFSDGDHFTRLASIENTSFSRVATVKQVVPVMLMLAIACNNGDGTAPITQPNDISSMNVGDVRVLTPDQIPNGIDLPVTSSARDYVIIVGNTNPTIDAVANFVVRADRTPTGSAQMAPSPTLSAQLNLSGQTINPPTSRQQALDARVRRFVRHNLG